MARLCSQDSGRRELRPEPRQPLDLGARGGEWAASFSEPQLLPL